MRSIVLLLIPFTVLSAVSEAWLAQPTQLTRTTRKALIRTGRFQSSKPMDDTKAFQWSMIDSIYQEDDSHNKRALLARQARVIALVNNDVSSWYRYSDTTPVAFGSYPDAIHHKNDVETDLVDVLPLYQLALAGSVTTFFADMLMHPMDCIKTMQQSEIISMMVAIERIVNTYGLAGFFNGFLTYAVSDSVSGALKFAVWEVWKRKMTPDSQENSHSPLSQFNSLLINFFGAALAFVASSVTLVPGELIKNQLQIGNFDSLQSAIFGLYEQSGIASFYTGYEAVLYRDVPYTMLELGLYEAFKKITKNKASSGTDDDSTWDEITAAAVTGAVTAILTTPLDMIKTTMMVDERFIDASFFETFLSIVQDHGPFAIFSGFVARVAWIVPFTAVYLPTYDALKRLLLKRYANKHKKQQQQSQPFTWS